MNQLYCRITYGTPRCWNMDKQICLNDISLLLPLQLDGVCFMSQAQWWVRQFNPSVEDANKLSDITCHYNLKSRACSPGDKCETGFIQTEEYSTCHQLLNRKNILFYLEDTPGCSVILPTLLLMLLILHLNAAHFTLNEYSTLIHLEHCFYSVYSSFQPVITWLCWSG